MAESEDTERTPIPELQPPKTGGPLMKSLPWLIPTGVVLVFALGGFLVGRSFGTRGHTGTAAGAEATAPAESAPPLKAGVGESW